MKRLATLFCLLIFTFNMSSQTTHPQLDSLIDATIKKYDIPSMAVSYIKSDTIVYGVQGKANKASEKSVTLNDKYHLGSNTKAITTYIAFGLIEKGLISLDTKFSDVVKNLGKIKSKYNDITLADLLSHNARIRPYTSGLEFKKLPDFNGSTMQKREQFAKHVLKKKPAKIGTYSNAGFALAALMLEKASNKEYEELVAETFDKLGLDYFFGFPNAQKIKYPWGHWEEQKKMVALSPEHPYRLLDFIAPAGDISMNIVDYSKFLQMHLNGFGGEGSTLSQSSFEKLFYEKDSYSYGWVNQINDRGNLVFHDGSTGTFYCHALISTTNNFAVTILMNTASDKQLEGMWKLRQELFNLRNSLL